MGSSEKETQNRSCPEKSPCNFSSTEFLVVFRVDSSSVTQQWIPGEPGPTLVIKYIHLLEGGWPL